MIKFYCPPLPPEAGMMMSDNLKLHYLRMILGKKPQIFNNSQSSPFFVPNLTLKSLGKRDANARQRTDFDPKEKHLSYVSGELKKSENFLYTYIVTTHESFLNLLT